MAMFRGGDDPKKKPKTGKSEAYKPDEGESTEDVNRAFQMGLTTPSTGLSGGNKSQADYQKLKGLAKAGQEQYFQAGARYWHKSKGGVWDGDLGSSDVPDGASVTHVSGKVGKHSNRQGEKATTKY